MPIRPEIMERTPLENVEIEYERSSRRRTRPGFNRARVLDINSESIELGARETFRQGEKVTLTMHIKGVREFMKVDGEVQKSTRITVLRQPAFSVLVQFGRLTDDQVRKVAWARDQLVPKTRPAPIRREEDKTVVAAPAATPPAAQKSAVAAQRPPLKEARPVPVQPPGVKRPVALLHLIDRLDKFAVSEDLIVAILEAAEAGMDVEVLYPRESDSDLVQRKEEKAEATVEALPTEGQARPMNVYRLASNTRLHFSETGQPVGPATELFYLSRLKSPETCFAVQLGVTSMTRPGATTFKQGSILVFSRTKPVESGDFAFIRTRDGDEFAQVFFDKNNEVRIRPLNPKYRERVVRRREVRLLYKLIGRYEDIGE